MTTIKTRVKKKVRSERYEDASEAEYTLMEELREKHFGDTNQARVKILFDGKKNVYNDKLTLGRIRRADELIRHLTISESQSIRGDIDRDRRNRMFSPLTM